MAKRAPIFVKRDLRECRKTLQRLGGELSLHTEKFKGARSAHARLVAEGHLSRVQSEIERIEAKVESLERELTPEGWEPRAWR